MKVKYIENAFIIITLLTLINSDIYNIFGFLIVITLLYGSKRDASRACIIIWLLRIIFWTIFALQYSH